MIVVPAQARDHDKRQRCHQKARIGTENMATIRLSRLRTEACRSIRSIEDRYLAIARREPQSDIENFHKTEQQSDNDVGDANQLEAASSAVRASALTSGPRASPVPGTCAEKTDIMLADQLDGSCRIVSDYVARDGKFHVTFS